MLVGFVLLRSRLGSVPAPNFWLSRPLTPWATSWLFPAPH
jgi:hypothetical protein